MGFHRLRPVLQVPQKNSSLESPHVVVPKRLGFHAEEGFGRPPVGAVALPPVPFEFLEPRYGTRAVVHLPEEATDLLLGRQILESQALTHVGLQDEGDSDRMECFHLGKDAGPAAGQPLVTRL